jgi:predicted amidohydrolase
LCDGKHDFETREEARLSESMSPAASARVGFLQTHPRFGEVERNLESAARRVAEAPPFELLVLPELFSTGYLFRDRPEALEFGESVDGPTVRALREWAASRGGSIVAGFAERDGGRLFNSAALAEPDGTVRVYRKVHLFDRENFIFDPGDRPFEAWDVETAGGGVRVGVMVCFDWVYPESARSLALLGAEVILHPSNLVLSHCQEAMRTRCLENRVWAVTANRTAEDDRGDLRLEFTGRSQIVAPVGKVITRAPADGECVVVEEVDLAVARDKKITERNEIFGGRRPDAYSG